MRKKKIDYAHELAIIELQIKEAINKNDSLLIKVLKEEELNILKKLKKKRKNEEQKLQRECVKWFRLRYPDKILYAIPNGGVRNKITAKQLQIQGVLAGVPDMHLAEIVNGKSLFIEIKTKNGYLSAEQKKLTKRLIEKGFEVAVIKSFDEFKSIVEKFLNN